MRFGRRLVIPTCLAVKNTDKLPQGRAILLFSRARRLADADPSRGPKAPVVMTF